MPAALAGTDPGTDLAVLKIDATTHAPVRTTTAPAPGTLALSIGRSEDSGVNATLGIISACSDEWRTWRGGRLDHYIRLDLTLYPGSDGGAVVSTAGATIGIATSALSRIAGLAIPAVTVDRVVDQILARGRVTRGYLGVGLQPVELPDSSRSFIPSSAVGTLPDHKDVPAASFTIRVAGAASCRRLRRSSPRSECGPLP